MLYFLTYFSSVLYNSVSHPQIYVASIIKQKQFWKIYLNKLGKLDELSFNPDWSAFLRCPFCFFTTTPALQCSCLCDKALQICYVHLSIMRLDVTK